MAAMGVRAASRAGTDDEMTNHRLVFLGAPGTGKGTQARRLQDRRGLIALSSGDVLRQEVQLGTPVGVEADGCMKRGVLVPDSVILGVMFAAVDRLGSGAGFILDGFPRTVPQAEALEAGLAARKLPLDGVIDFCLSDDEIFRRIVDRRVCKKCGRTYNLSFVPPRQAGVCDDCRSELIQRPDDRRDVIATRLETYRALTAPLIAFYEKRGLLHEVDATAATEQVADVVIKVVEGLDGTK